jgi:hypothetical protein
MFDYDNQFHRVRFLCFSPPAVKRESCLIARQTMEDFSIWPSALRRMPGKLNANTVVRQEMAPGVLKSVELREK